MRWRTPWLNSSPGVRLTFDAPDYFWTPATARNAVSAASNAAVSTFVECVARLGSHSRSMPHTRQTLIPPHWTRRLPRCVRLQASKSNPAHRTSGELLANCLARASAIASAQQIIAGDVVRASPRIRCVAIRLLVPQEPQGFALCRAPSNRLTVPVQDR